MSFYLWFSLFLTELNPGAIENRCKRVLNFQFCFKETSIAVQSKAHIFLQKKSFLMNDQASALRFERL
jgi:hypothetical protein